MKKFKDHIRNDIKEIAYVQNFVDKIAKEGDIAIIYHENRIVTAPKSLKDAHIELARGSPWIYVFNTILDGRSDYRPHWVIVYQSYRHDNDVTYYRFKRTYPTTDDNDPQDKFVIVKPR